MQNNTTCQLMEELSSSNVLTSSLLFTLLSCAIIIPMALLASYHLWFSRTASLFHKNLRIIIQFHLLGFLIHSGDRFILHSIDLFNYLFEDPCDMIPNVWRCFWLRLIYAIGLWITSTTVIPLVLERWIATKYNAVHILILYSGSQIEGVVMTYCMVARDSKVNVGEINGYATVVVQLLARIVFQYLYKRNEKLRKEQLASSLSTRFQLEQNLLVMDILKMFANMSTIYLGLHAFSFIGVLKLKHIVTPPVYFALVELNSSYPIYGIVSILLMYYMLHSNRQKIHNNLQIHVNSKWNGEFFDKR
ncbi:hypothetical protein CRE_27338 [Caenorhabditis remanei]|uniref:Uncharacterized protein n=1 Tax=Caenorhabditis remanei TaxID=31234 RepID=E3LPT4_CAERE|nr:hypothetical protein CRE_27338 [Caenorhabditis remanei]